MPTLRVVYAGRLQIVVLPTSGISEQLGPKLLGFKLFFRRHPNAINTPKIYKIWVHFPPFS